MINVTTLILKLSISHFLMVMFLALHLMESISLNSFVLLASSYITDFNTRNKLLTQKLLKQGYRYHKLRKTFSKFYRQYYDLIYKFQVGQKFRYLVQSLLPKDTLLRTFLNLSCAKDFRNLDSTMTWCIN